MRLIDADELFQKAIGIIKDKIGDKEFGILNMITIAETIDAEPAKHGKWLDTRNISYSARCSECGRYTTDITPYCSNCGAKMDGNDKQEES